MNTKQRLMLIGGLILVVMVWLLVSPPRFWLNLTKSVDLSDPVATGAQAVERYDYRSCHQIEGQGAYLGPDLAGIAQKYDELILRLWLKNPKAVKGNTAMPNFKLSDSEIEAIIRYLKDLD